MLTLRLRPPETIADRRPIISGLGPARKAAALKRVSRVVSGFDCVRNIGYLAAVAYLDDLDAFIAQRRRVKCHRASADSHNDIVTRNFHDIVVFVLAYQFAHGNARDLVTGVLFDAVRPVVFEQCG